MKILIVAATQREVKHLTELLTFRHRIDANFNNYEYGTLNIDILITGSGTVFTAYYVTKTLSLINYDLAINVGLAGSYDYFLEQGFVVNVVQEEFGDAGADDDGNFHTMIEKELMDENQYPFVDGKLITEGSFSILEVETLIPVKAITLNTTRSKKEEIEVIKKRFNPDIETQEGAAFFYTCMMEKIPFLQLRAISHYVELRKVENWTIPDSLKALKNTMHSILNELNQR